MSTDKRAVGGGGGGGHHLDPAATSTHGDTDSDTYLIPQTHSSMGPTRVIGESALGPRRVSCYGTFSRVALLAIDASSGAKYAFHCEHRPFPTYIQGGPKKNRTVFRLDNFVTVSP